MRHAERQNGSLSLGFQLAQVIVNSTLTVSHDVADVLLAERSLSERVNMTAESVRSPQKMRPFHLEESGVLMPRGERLFDSSPGAIEATAMDAAESAQNHEKRTTARTKFELLRIDSGLA